MTHIYSHSFKFETVNSKDVNKPNKNIISIIEEDSKKHYINYIRYEFVDDTTIHTREISAQVDRHYYLEIANIAIDDIERRKRLFTIIGKRCFGRNDNKLDSYLFDKKLNIKDIFSCYKKYRLDSYSHPILFELVKHTTNKYEAYPFYCQNNYFATLKQTNISNRKTFQKTFLVQMTKANYTKLLSYQTNELKIEFIFNLIGEIYFKNQPLEEKNYSDLDFNVESMIDKKLQEMSDGTITNQTFMSEDLFKSLKSSSLDIEKSYFNLLSRGMKFINEPESEETIFLFTDSVSDFIAFIEDEEEFEEITSLLEIIKVIAKERKISYLMKKRDQDLQDIFLFLLETITVWNNSLSKDDLGSFNKSTLDLYNTLKYFVDTYFKFYYDYQSKDAKVNETVPLEVEKSEDTTNKVSAEEYFSDIELDYSILEELEELEVDLEEYIFSNSFDSNSKKAFIAFLDGYTRMLNLFYEFRELSYALALLSNKLNEYDFSKENEMLFLLLKSITADLVEWKQSVFIKQDAEDIHYIDQSFYANVAQIDISMSDNEDSENEIEFF